MSNDNSNSIHETGYHDSIEKVSSFFVSTKGLREVVEITYAYDLLGSGRYFNKTLFQDLVDTAGCDTYQDYVDVVLPRLEHIIHTIQRFATQLQDTTDHVGIIVYRYCLYAIDMLEIALIGLPFEIEKMGLDIPFSATQRQQRLTMIQHNEQKWFGELVKDNKYESSRVLYYLEEYLQQYGKQRLSAHEIVDFKRYIEILKNTSSYTKEYCRDDEDHEYWIMTGQDYFDQHIHRDVYAQIFTHLFAIYGIEKTVHIDSRSSMYDALDGLYIPDNDAYKTLPLQRILELMHHEIETHFLIQHNTAKLLPISDGANSLYKEEGLAKFMEEILDGATLLSMDISPSMIQILMCELLAGDDLIAFLKLYWKLKDQPDNREPYLLRRKRNYPLDLVGTQHKDVTYGRGRFNVRGYLMNGGTFSSLFLAKVDFDDIKRLETTITTQQQNALLFPLFISERILYTLVEERGSFEEYIAGKYPFIDFTTYQSLALDEKQQFQFDSIVGLIQDALHTPTYYQGPLV